MITVIRAIVCLLASVFISGFVQAQQPTPLDVLNQGVGALFRRKAGIDLRKSPITTDFSDANTNAPVPDNFGDNLIPKRLYHQPRDADGSFQLRSGLYEMTCRSYCLKAGTHGPSQGDGYLLAPADGPMRDLVVAILRNSEHHPNIRQQQVQLLLWAIIARTNFKNLSPQLQTVAYTLVSGKDLARWIGRGVGSEFAQTAYQQLLRSAPPALHQILQAEHQMRSLFQQASYRYADFERLAVMSGAAFVDRPDIRRGRWSRHPDGYYTRYYPSSYSQTRVQVFVPDELGGARVNFADDIAVPANTGAQRLGQSNVPVDEKPVDVPTADEPVAQIPPTMPAPVPTNPVPAPTSPSPTTTTAPVSVPPAPAPVAPLLLAGQLLNKNTRQPIEGTVLLRTTGQPALADSIAVQAGPRAAGSRAASQFERPIVPGQRYSYRASALGYAPAEGTIDPGTMTTGTLRREILLTPLTVNTSVRLDNVYFVQSKDSLLAASYPELNSLVKLMQDNPGMEIRLEGHTDRLGDFDKNMLLSNQRVERVKRYLVEQNIAAQRVTTQGFGPTRPVTKGTSEAERRKNRRVEFVITKMQSAR